MSLDGCGRPGSLEPRRREQVCLPDGVPGVYLADRSKKRFRNCPRTPGPPGGRRPRSTAGGVRLPGVAPRGVPRVHGVPAPLPIAFPGTVARPPSGPAWNGARVEPGFCPARPGTGSPVFLPGPARSSGRPPPLASAIVDQHLLRSRRPRPCQGWRPAGPAAPAADRGGGRAARSVERRRARKKRAPVRTPCRFCPAWSGSGAPAWSRPLSAWWWAWWSVSSWWEPPS